MLGTSQIPVIILNVSILPSQTGLDVDKHSASFQFGAEQFDAHLADTFAEFNSQRQANVAQPDNCDCCCFGRGFHAETAIP